MLPQAFIPHIGEWEFHQKVTPWKVHLDDYTYEAPAADLEQDDAFDAEVVSGKRAVAISHSLLADGVLELREHFADRFHEDQDEGKLSAEAQASLFAEKERLAKVRLEQETVNALWAMGTTNYSHFVPGRTFHLVDAGEDSGDYFITEVEHSFMIGFEGGDDAIPYGCRFRCIPKSLPYRTPSGHAQSVCAGTESATTIAYENSEVMTNDLACVKAKFDWDQDEGLNSPWMRVRQSLAGSGYGEVFLPRRDHEVTVAYEEGDPDRPIVLGSLYNAQKRHTRRHNISPQRPRLLGTLGQGHLRERESFHLRPPTRQGDGVALFGT